MGAGVFLTRYPSALSAGVPDHHQLHAPDDAAGLDVVDPYTGILSNGRDGSSGSRSFFRWRSRAGTDMRMPFGSKPSSGNGCVRCLKQMGGNVSTTLRCPWCASLMGLVTPPVIWKKSQQRWLRRAVRGSRRRNWGGRYCAPVSRTFDPRRKICIP